MLYERQRVLRYNGISFAPFPLLLRTQLKYLQKNVDHPTDTFVVLLEFKAVNVIFMT